MFGRDRGVTVLGYHLVGADTPSVVDVPLGDFRRHVEYLRRRLNVIAPKQVLGGGRGAVLTFDDGFANFSEVVWPVLRELGVPVILFVPTGFVDETSPSPLSGAPLKPVTWNDLRRMAREGLSVGSHSVTHRDLRRLSDKELHWELWRSQQRLQDELGIPIEDICYPQAKWDARVTSAARRYYLRGFVAGGRRAQPEQNPLAIPRFPIKRSLKRFELLARSRRWWPEVAADQLRRMRA